MAYCAVLLTVLFVFLVGVFLIARSDTAYTAARRRIAEEKLNGTGLELLGDALASFELRGAFQGVPMRLANLRQWGPPGRPEQDRSVGVVTVETPLSDIIVCRAGEVDTIMGPIPAVPRSASGHARFDAEYAIFLSPGPEDERVDFRTAPGATALSWAKSPILNQMADMELQWLRVQNRRCELVIPPVEPENVGAALSLGANFVLSINGRPLVPVQRPKTAPGVRAPRSPLTPLSTGALVAGLGSLVGWIPISFHPWIREMTEDSVCGTGGRLLVRESFDGDSTSADLYCSNDPHASLFLHGLASALSIGVAVLVISLVMALQRLASRAPADGVRGSAERAPLG